MIKSRNLATSKGTSTLAARTTLIIMMVALATGCASLENEEGRLPDAMRKAMQTFSASGYPDLTKLPEAPKDVPSSVVWAELEAVLVEQGREVASNPSASALTPDESDLSWAQNARVSLETDPLAQPIAPAQPGALSQQDQAAAARAKFDADLARLPPL